MNNAMNNELENLENKNENEGMDLYNEAMEKLKSLNLAWTYKSINMIVRNENLSFNQLRSCVYMNKNKEGYYDLYKSVYLLIKSGLIGSNQLSITDKTIDTKVEEIIENWRSEIGFIGILHILMIKQMEDKHFFINKPSMKVLEYMSSENLSKELVDKTLLMELQEKIQQAQALQN